MLEWMRMCLFFAFALLVLPLTIGMFCAEEANKTIFKNTGIMKAFLYVLVLFGVTLLTIFIFRLIGIDYCFKNC